MCYHAGSLGCDQRPQERPWIQTRVGMYVRGASKTSQRRQAGACQWESRDRNRHSMGMRVLKQWKQVVQSPRGCCMAKSFLGSSPPPRRLQEKLPAPQVLHRDVWEKEPMQGVSNQQLGPGHLLLGFASFCSCHMNLAFYSLWHFYVGTGFLLFYLSFRPLIPQLLKEK